ncbi:MAG TPA: PQQ-binding-like beta-propeller repeat protein [Segeticoccus sp.]|uniref:outer membrane protein assembly factor BamB family protein n=1 Tax=Segeticoccus sp. TaxID=2706531 RepID=UPI002D7F4EE7|nr:PQQ-binding-like beta-propeller repeat protein [Segeticoccus sp.]HET8600132.1 PQQ-binding-like beta-propeller repeat protein [Segeticoccus sp.]
MSAISSPRSPAPVTAQHPRAAQPSRSTAPSSGAGPGQPWQGRPLGPGAGHLHPGSDPHALPTGLLIADKANNRLIIVDAQGRIRWRFPRPGDLRPGQTFRVPDDAFFTPDGRHIIVTEEDDFVIRVIDIATHRIVYHYGTPGSHGAGPNQLWNPDDAIMLRDGSIVTADIKNQRLLHITEGAHRPARVWGGPTGGYHDPPRAWGAPNGMFPSAPGEFLVTEIRGDWVTAMSLQGQVRWSTHPPGVLYPSDTNQVGPDRYLTTDYSAPGQIVIFTRTGRPLWRYRPTGAAALDHPSLALPMPNGDIVCNDDYNQRVIVIDPHTNKIVWQYGHTHHAGRAPGYLSNPDGLDLVPPNSLVDRTLHLNPSSGG